MLQLKCLYVSESGKSASFAVTKNHGAVSARLATGFLETNEEIEAGDELELDYENVDTVTSTTDDGREFDWLVFN